MNGDERRGCQGSVIFEFGANEIFAGNFRSIIRTYGLIDGRHLKNCFRLGLGPC